ATGVAHEERITQDAIVAVDQVQETTRPVRGVSEEAGQGTCGAQASAWLQTLS
ncbi:hypothetical protein TorRG33x02_333180, partial [Trema orientale]